MDKEVKIIPPEGYEVDEENSTFECIKFKSIKPQLPTTWEEFCDTHKVQQGESWVTTQGVESQNSSIPRCRFTLSHKNILPTKELAVAMEALCQLIQLRECYNDGWEPDWTNSKWKFCLTTVKNNIVKESLTSANTIMSFKSEELRNKFLENFKDLIETAKPLL